MFTFVCFIIGSCILQPVLHAADAADDVTAAFSSNRFRVEYLRQFGYMGSTATIPTGINEISDEVVEYVRSGSGDELDEVSLIPDEVVRKLQLFAGVPQTGQFDEQTIEMMMTPRCQNPDIIYDSSNSLTGFFLGAGPTRKKRFAGQTTPKWDKFDLTFAFENTTPQNPRARSIISSAFAAWGECTKLTFRAAEDGDDSPDIKLKFASRLHAPPEGCSFDGPGGVKAHAFYPPQGLAHFDEEEDWSNDCVLYSVGLHEIGHLLGIGHSFHKSSIMFAYFNSDFVKERCGSGSSRPLASHDIESVRALYGSVSCDKAEDHPDNVPTPSPTPSEPPPGSDGTLDPLKEVTTSPLGETTLPDSKGDDASTPTGQATTSASGSMRATYATGADNSWKLRCGEVRDNVLSSPYYPDLYPNKMNCSWNFSVPQGMETINLYFIDFELEEGGDDCVFDYLKITEEDGTSRKLCGTHTDSLEFHTKHVVLNFVSDTLKQYAGFKVLVVFDKAPPCLKVFEEAEGVVRESHPDLDMRDHEECTYHIKSSDPEKQIMLIFEDIGDDCEKYELLTDQEEGAENLLGSCDEFGSGGVRHFVSPSDSFFIKFRPQDQVRFTVKYYTIFGDQYWRNCTDTLRNDYDQEFLESKEWSPKLADNSGYSTTFRLFTYLPNTDCILYIPRHEGGKEQVLIITDLDLEADKRCSYDFVEVYTEENGTVRHCGQSERVEYTTLGDSLVYFHSDGTVEGTGFTLDLSVYTCEEELVRTGGEVSLQHGCTYTFKYSSNIGHFVCTDLTADRGRCKNNYVSIGYTEEKNCKSFSTYIYGRGEAEIKVHKETESNYAMQYLRIDDDRDCFNDIEVTAKERFHKTKMPSRHRDHRIRNARTCLWRLIGEAGKQIVLSFTQINLKRSCDEEYITVYPTDKGCEGGKKFCKSYTRKGGQHYEGANNIRLESQDAYILFIFLDKKSQFRLKVKLEDLEVPEEVTTTPTTVSPTTAFQDLDRLDHGEDVYITEDHSTSLPGYWTEANYNRGRRPGDRDGHHRGHG